MVLITFFTSKQLSAKLLLTYASNFRQTLSMCGKDSFTLKNIVIKFDIKLILVSNESKGGKGGRYFVGCKDGHNFIAHLAPFLSFGHERIAGNDGITLRIDPEYVILEVMKAAYHYLLDELLVTQDNRRLIEQTCNSNPR